MTPEYRQLWRIVDGAVYEAFRAHPDYIAAGKRPEIVRGSIVKRVVGAVSSHAEQSARVRSGSSPAHDMVVSGGSTEQPAEGCVTFRKAGRHGPAVPHP